MHKSKVDFEIPIDIKHDLVYCQRALTTHILMHQVSIHIVGNFKPLIVF